MLLSEVLDTQPELDADYIVERIEAEMLIELFGGLGGVARAGMDKMKQVGQGIKQDYNNGEVRALLAQLGKYKDQLKTLIQRNPQSFAQQAATTQAQRAATTQAQYQQGRSSARFAQRQEREAAAAHAAANPAPPPPSKASAGMASLSAAESRMGTPRPARRRVEPGMKSNFDPVTPAPTAASAPATSAPTAAPAMTRRRPLRPGKPHIRSRAPRMESQEVHDQIITELFGGLGGVARAGFDKMKQTGRDIGASYSKGEARVIIKKMMDVMNALKERGYQLPPELAKEIAAIQQAAA